jgi:hypothetical protein
MNKQPMGPPNIDLEAMHEGMDDVGIAFSFVSHIEDPLQDDVPDGYDEASMRDFYMTEAENFLPKVVNEGAKKILEQTLATYKK